MDRGVCFDGFHLIGNIAQWASQEQIGQNNTKISGIFGLLDSYSLGRAWKIHPTCLDEVKVILFSNPKSNFFDCDRIDRYKAVIGRLVSDTLAF